MDAKYIVVLYDGENTHPATEFVYDVDGDWTLRVEADPMLYDEEYEAREFADSVDCGIMEEIEVELYKGE